MFIYLNIFIWYAFKFPFYYLTCSVIHIVSVQRFLFSNKMNFKIIRILNLLDTD